MLTLNEQEEKVIDKIIAAIADCISLDAIQTISVPASGMTFPGLEIRQIQHRVYRMAVEPLFARVCTFTQPTVPKQSNTL